MPGLLQGDQLGRGRDGQGLRSVLHRAPGGDYTHLESSATVREDQDGEGSFRFVHQRKLLKSKMLKFTLKIHILVA